MIFSYSILLILLSISLNALNITEYVEVVIELAKNQSSTIEYENSISRLMELDPDYFDYSPYKSYLRKFNCQLLPSSPIATSVHQLKPTDIKYVAAMGDSLSAGLGADAKTLLDLLFEYRGKAFSAGGDGNLDCVVSLPNILKKFNPSIRGFSLGKDYLLHKRATNHLNVALSGSEVKNMPQQARDLVERFRTLYTDYETQWKLITLFIGGNDLCDYCNDRSLHSPKSFAAYLKESLDILANNLPKTFVNLVTTLNVSSLKYLGKNLICKLIHQRVCPCALSQSIEQERELNEYANGYQNVTRELINSKRYERDDFTVVIQPFLQDTTPPLTSNGKIDTTYFAPDCFHMSLKGHTQAAIALWNSMLTKIDKKPTKWDTESQIMCPDTKQPYFRTGRN